MKRQESFLISTSDSDFSVIKISGRLYDGRSSGTVNTRLSIYSDGTVIVDTGQERKKRHVDSLTISPRVGDSARFIDLPEGSRFETTDNDSVDRVAAAFKKGATYKFFTWLENSTKVFGILFLLIIFTVFASVKWGIPTLAETVAYQIPVSLLSSADDMTIKSLDSEYTKPSALSNVKKEEVRGIFRDTTAAFTQHNIQFKLIFRKGGLIGANAFALPGGTVMITDELIGLSKHHDELRGIMAHEIGHIVLRHSARTILQSSIVVLAVSTFVGDASSLASLISAVPTLLINGKYSRDFEREADSFSLKYMRRMDIDPSHLVNILERLHKSHKGIEIPAFLSTHPPVEERRELLLNTNN